VNVGFEQPLIGPAVIRRIGGVRYRCAESGGHWGVQTSYFRCSGQCAGIRLSSDGKHYPDAPRPSSAVPVRIDYGELSP
jgi:hypothetical protein